MVDERLRGVEEDVVFDTATADDLISAFTSLASTIEDQAASRSTYVTTASTDFSGYFAGLFADNASVAAADATELCSRLREVATGARRLKEEAAKEQSRRVVARQWKKERDERNAVEQVLDSVVELVAGDDVPVGPPAEPVSVAVSEPVTGTRTTYEPGSVAGQGGGTSAARPENLRSFVTGSHALNAELVGRPASLRSHLSDFASKCQHGTLSADGVVSGLETWMSQNDNDVSWAQTLADAFAAAGGEGEVSAVADSALTSALEAAGATIVRQDLEISPVEAVGGPVTSGYAVDPVNTATGNFVEHEVDLSFSGGSASLRLERTYSSLLEAEGVFGPGWASALDSRLDLGPEGAVWVMADGRHVRFARSGTGWDRAAGESLWLAAEAPPQAQGAAGQDGEDCLVVRDNAGGWWSFTSSGTWTGCGREEGSDVTVERGRDGQVAAVVHERGRRVDLDYQDGRVVVARSSDGRRAEYDYDGAGRLVAVSSPLGTRRYEWTSSGLIESVWGADGHREVANTYDATGRVVGQVTAQGREVRLAYMPGRLTVVSDADGNRSSTWVADARGRVVGIVDSEGHRQSMGYDRWGNLVSVRERDGSHIVHRYDDRGRRVRTAGPAGSGLLYEWDQHDRLVQVTSTAGATVRYEYEGTSRLPSVIVDPEGGRSLLAWSDGLLSRAVDPTGVAVDLEHDAHGDVVALTDAEGGTVRLVRDAAGRVSQAVSPSGARTTFTYDEAGLLVRRRDADGAVWRWEHGPGGQVTAVIDPAGPARR